MYKDYDGHVKNVTTYFLLSNHLDSVRVEARDRRYFILQASDAMIDNKAYFDHLILEVYEHPMFYPTLLSFFLHMQLNGFSPKSPPPVTLLKEELIDESRCYQEVFIMDRKWWENRRNKTRDCVAFSEVWDDFNEYLVNVVGKDQSKFAGNRQHFFAKVSQWVIKGQRAPGHNVSYEPNAKLLALWSKQDEEDEKLLAADPEVQKRYESIATIVVETVTAERKAAEIHKELVENQRKAREKPSFAAAIARREEEERKELKQKQKTLETKIRAMLKRCEDITPDDEKWKEAHAIVDMYDLMKEEVDEKVIEDINKEISVWHSKYIGHGK
jgi:hypothetical protein